MLGGEDFDEVLLAHLLKDFKSDQGIDLGGDNLAMQRLREVSKTGCETSGTPGKFIILPRSQDWM